MKEDRKKTFRITYTKSNAFTVELEAGNATSAWKEIQAGEYDAVWDKEGELKFEVVACEEITKHMAPKPK